MAQIQSPSLKALVQTTLLALSMQFWHASAPAKDFPAPSDDLPVLVQLRTKPQTMQINVPALDRLVPLESLQAFTNDYPPFMCGLNRDPQGDTPKFKSYFYACPAFYKGHEIIFNLLDDPQRKDWIINMILLDGQPIGGVDLTDFIKKPRQARFNSFQTPRTDVELWQLKVDMQDGNGPQSVGEFAALFMNFDRMGYTCFVAVQRDPTFVFACVNKNPKKEPITQLTVYRLNDHEARLDKVDLDWGRRVVDFRSNLIGLARDLTFEGD